MDRRHPNQPYTERTQAVAPARRDLVAHWTDASGEKRHRRFSQDFLIGRLGECDLRLEFDSVSRRHAAVFVKAGRWWVRDMGSSNGTYLANQRVTEVPLGEESVLRIGVDGPLLALREHATRALPSESVKADGTDDATVVLSALGRPSRLSGARSAVAGASRSALTTANGQPQDSRRVTIPSDQHRVTPDIPLTPEAIAERYFRPIVDPEVGSHTQAFQLAFQAEQKKVTRRHFALLAGVIALATMALGGAGFYLLRQQQQIEESRRLAIDLFYDVKDLELELARLRDTFQTSHDAALAARMEANRRKLQLMAERYERQLDQQALLSLGKNVDQKELTILRMARLFGECELNMPDGFLAEVNTYIAKWKSSSRLVKAISAAQGKGYTSVIRDAMQAQELPPQFFYLALQESNFNERAVGPATRYGYAKGAWQFIPSTATRYGLKVGPLADQPVYDPDDERFDFVAAANAAARYLRRIYETDAQASGLLVMASYNWGEGNIIKRIRSMPENPRERNFWKLVEKYKIPDETYNYVLYIFSAAVIGEKPHLFGFEFESPI